MSDFDGRQEAAVFVLAGNLFKATSQVNATCLISEHVNVCNHHVPTGMQASKRHCENEAGTREVCIFISSSYRESFRNLNRHENNRKMPPKT
jgi:hypothetical protein